MRRPLTPLWLAERSRVAGLSQRAARIGLALLGLFLLATLSVLTMPPSLADTGFYASVVDGVRHGGNYYAVTADALRGGDYPLRPVFTFELPTLAVVTGHLPPFVVRLLLYALVVAAATAWHARLKAALATTGARWFAAAMLFFALVPMLRPSLIVVPEAWAALFVALSLAVRKPGQWLDAVALGLAAALICQTAIVYLVIMAVFALVERTRRESLGWVVAIGVFLVAFAAHVHAVGEVVRPLDPAGDPFGLLGFGLFVDGMVGATILAFLPLWLAGPLVGIALFGWAVWRNATGLRAIALAVAAAIGIALFGRDNTAHWALLLAPLLLPGLAFAADGVRDLLGAALDGRRITVTRIVR